MTGLSTTLTWDEAAEWIGRELHRLMERQAEWIGTEDLLPDEESNACAVRDLRSLDAETRETLDAAVAEFADRGEWPPLSIECRYLLSRRLFCALDLLHTLSLPAGRPLVPQSTATPKEILLWLLNITWRSRAERWLQITGSSRLQTPSNPAIHGDFGGGR